MNKVYFRIEKKIHRLAKAYRKQETGLINMKNRNREVITVPEEINDYLTTYFEKLLNVE